MQRGLDTYQFFMFSEDVVFDINYAFFEVRDLVAHMFVNVEIPTLSVLQGSKRMRLLDLDTLTRLW